MKRPLFLLLPLVLFCILSIHTDAATVGLKIDDMEIPYGTKVYFEDTDGHQIGPLFRIVFQDESGNSYVVYEYGNMVYYHTPTGVSSEFVICGEQPAYYSDYAPSSWSDGAGHSFGFAGWAMADAADGTSFTSEDARITARSSAPTMSGSEIHLYAIMKYTDSLSSSYAGGTIYGPPCGRSMHYQGVGERYPGTDDTVVVVSFKCSEGHSDTIGTWRNGDVYRSTDSGDYVSDAKSRIGSCTHRDAIGTAAAYGLSCSITAYAHGRIDLSWSLTGGGGYHPTATCGSSSSSNNSGSYSQHASSASISFSDGYHSPSRSWSFRFNGFE